MPAMLLLIWLSPVITPRVRGVSLQPDSQGRRASAEHQRRGAVLVRTQGELAAHSAERWRRAAVSVFSFTILIAGLHSPGVAPPGQRARSTGGRLPPARPTALTPTPKVGSFSLRVLNPHQGPPLPGAQDGSPSSGAGDSDTPRQGNTTSGARSCHRRSAAASLPRAPPEGHFRGAAHIKGDRAPALLAHHPQGHTVAGAHTSCRTIRGPRTHLG